MLTVSILITNLINNAMIFIPPITFSYVQREGDVERTRLEIISYLWFDLENFIQDTMKLENVSLLFRT